MDERSSLAKQYEVMFNECVKFAESTVLDVTRDPGSFERLSAAYQSKVYGDPPGKCDYYKNAKNSSYAVTEIDGFSLCESSVPYIDVFSSVV